MSQFWDFVAFEFGESYGRVLVNDLSLTGVGGRTAQEALHEGRDPREVWLALCEAAEVPPERWHGRDKPSARAAARAAESSPRVSPWPAEWPH